LKQLATDDGKACTSCCPSWIIGGQSVDNKSIWRWSGPDASAVWSIDRGSVINMVRLDSSQNVYYGGNDHAGKSVWAADKDGNALWDYNTGGDVFDVVVDDIKGRVFVSGQNISGKNVWALDIEDGSKLWDALVQYDSDPGHEDKVRGLNLTSDKQYLYVGTYQPNNTWKRGLSKLLASSGSEIWAKEFDGVEATEIGAITSISSSDGSPNQYFYVGVYHFGLLGFPRLRKYDHSGTMQWEIVPSGSVLIRVFAIKIGPDDNIYTCGALVYQYDPANGTENWKSVGSGDDLVDLDISQSGKIYVANTDSGINEYDTSTTYFTMFVLIMSCCRIPQNITQSYAGLFAGEKYEFTDGRVRICQSCDRNIWIDRCIFCTLRIRRFGRTIWPDPLAFIPAIARIENEHCSIGKW